MARFGSNGRRRALIAVVLSLAVHPVSALAQQDDDGDDGPGKPPSEITVNARRLDAARANIEASLGAATYTLTNDAVEARPSGETTTIARILLQAPGVSQDGSGSLRLRQSQGNLQYRINNVLLPDGLTDLGESLSARLATKVELVTGALPAQYGLTAGGVVNVTTKDGVYLDGGQAELYGGGPGEIEPAFEYGGSIGATNLFVTGSYQTNRLGTPSPDGSAIPLHDRTKQLEGFAYLDHLLSSQDRISLILGASDERFEVPNRRSLNAASADLGPVPFQRPLMIDGSGNFASEARDAHRSAKNRYAVVSLLHTTDKLSLQVGTFARYTETTRDAAGTAEILFTGAGRTTLDRTTSLGTQAEAALELGEAHTLRSGLVVISDIQRSSSQTTALPIDAAGVQTSGAILAFDATTRTATRKDSVFLQDEFRASDKVTLNLGGRIDHLTRPQDSTRFSPRASLVWKPDAETTVHFGYARYTLAAPVEGAGTSAATLAATSARLPGPADNDPKPETDDYFELGAQHTAGGFTAAIDAYWREATNLIDEGHFGASDETAAFNYERGRIRGIEFSMTYRANRLSGWANVALGDARAQKIASSQSHFTPAQIAFLSTHTIRPSNTQAVTVSGGASYRFDALRLSTALLYGSGQARTVSGGTPNAAHLPGYVQVDLSAVWRVTQFHQKPLDLRMDLINAFDRRYQLSDGTALGTRLPQWAARRGLFVGIEQAF